MTLVMAESRSLHRARGHICWVGQAAQNSPRPSFARPRWWNTWDVDVGLLGYSVMAEYKSPRHTNPTNDQSQAKNACIRRNDKLGHPSLSGLN